MNDDEKEVSLFMVLIACAVLGIVLTLVAGALT